MTMLKNFFNIRSILYKFALKRKERETKKSYKSPALLGIDFDLPRRHRAANAHLFSKSAH